MRCFVGIGESSFTCLAPSMIADLFTKDKRTHILAVFYLAIPFGSGLSFIVGSKATEFFQDWRWALRMSSPITILSLICFALFVKEPNREIVDAKFNENQEDNLQNDVIHLLRK